jgi:hypothetical protein
MGMSYVYIVSESGWDYDIIAFFKQEGDAWQVDDFVMVRVPFASIDFYLVPALGEGEGYIVHMPSYPVQLGVRVGEQAYLHLFASR